MKILSILFLGILSLTNANAIGTRDFFGVSQVFPDDPIRKSSDTTQIARTYHSAYEQNWDQRQIFAYLGEPKESFSDAEIADKIRGLNYAIPSSGKIWRGFGKGHKGIDIDLNTGDPIAAVFEGKVRYAMYNRGGFGNLVIIRHPNGLETWYAHLSKIKVKPDQVIEAGQIIGLGGSTGRSRSPHLHLELRYRDVAIDVQKFIDLENKTLTPLVSMGQEPVPSENDPRFSEATLLPEGTETQVNSSTPVVQEPETPQEVWYRIKSGDTLGRIAYRNGTTVSALCKMNRITPKTILKIGRSIRVG